MNLIERVANAYTAFSGTDKQENSLGNNSRAEFLRYTRNHKPLLQDWSQVEMSDQDMYTGYSYAAINKRANRASVLGKKFLYTEASPALMTAAKDKGEKLEHPYLKLIKKSKEFSQRRFWNDISTYLDLEGIYYLMAVRAIGENTDGTAKVGEIQKFVMLNPYQVRRVKRQSDGAVGGYIESRDGMYREIPKEMIIEIRLLNPFDNDEPFSMTDAAKESQFTMKQAGDYTRHSIKGNINSPGIISTDVVLEDHLFDNFVSRIENHEKGEPVYGNGSGAVKWESMQIDLDKAALDKINEIHRSTLFAVSGVSKTAMGIEESGTGREVSKTQKDDFTENAVMPQVEDIIDALNLDYRRYYPEWDKDEYEILLDNPLESDREAELADIEIRENELNLRDKLVEMGYEYDIASKYAHGEISLAELGEPTLEEELTDQEAEAIAMKEMGLDPGPDQEPENSNEEQAMSENNLEERFYATNKFVTKEENEKRLVSARKRVKARIKAEKEETKRIKQLEKEAKEETKKAAKAQSEETKALEKKTGRKVIEHPPVSKSIETEEEEVENSIEDNLRMLNQVASRDFPDLYDDIDIDTDKLGCIMINTEKIPVMQYIKDGASEVYNEGSHSGVSGEKEPHVTLLFGLLENGSIWKDKVDTVLEGWELPTVTIKEVSYFDLGESYVIVGLVEKTPELVDGHERLGLLPHVNTFSEYVPHISLVYINHDADPEKWVKALAKKYNGQKVATKDINYGDLPDDDNEVEKNQGYNPYRDSEGKFAPGPRKSSSGGGNISSKIVKRFNEFSLTKQTQDSLNGDILEKDYKTALSDTRKELAATPQAAKGTWTPRENADYIRKQALNNKPKVVNSSEYDTLKKSGDYYVVYRNAGEAKYINSFKKGENTFNDFYMYGAAVYFSTDKKFATGGEFAKGKEGAVFEALIPKNKVLNYQLGGPRKDISPDVEWFAKEGKGAKQELARMAASRNLTSVVTGNAGLHIPENDRYSEAFSTEQFAVTNPSFVIIKED